MDGLSRIVGLIALALIDSINPSAIVVTLYLLAASSSRVFAQVMVYVAAIFISYLTLGAMMLLGIDALLPSGGDVLRSRTGLIAQSVIGLTLLIYGLTASKEGASSHAVAPPSAKSYVALAALGIGVTAMELPTAIPYFAAIALITEAELPIRAWAPLLGMYNLIFVLPPVALLVGHVVFGRRLAEPYAALRLRLQRGARETVLWVAGLVGGWLFTTSLIELAARFR